MVCVYQEPPPAQPSRVEAELSAMNKRLDQLFSLLVPVAPISPDPRAAGLSDEYDASTEAGASPFDLPSKLLGNSSVMDVLGLDTDFAKSLIRGERTAQADESSEGGRPHLLIVHHRHAVSGLEGHDTNTVEMTRRVYWGVLLLEKYAIYFTHYDRVLTDLDHSEIAGQLDLARSDIWCLDECVPLPLCQQTWEFTPEMASKALATSSPPHDAPLLNASEDATRSYFLAEVAMRRMLHRCNTAVQATSTGKYVYAPYIAVELERQLEEWYCHLLNISRFDKGDAMQDEGSAGLLRDDCQKFFDSYILLTPSIVAAFQDCLVNRWTLFVSSTNASEQQDVPIRPSYEEVHP
ncbi:unnamed protein product [Aspergillus niger]|nr:unnamed protein product [Aspergillus niger]